ncbi:MAG: hypothetical protein HC880_04565 [Bacteroidia bacterium]|nr:hypothetical protein [Bacteroidia bacterium]
MNTSILAAQTLSKHIYVWLPVLFVLIGLALAVGSALRHDDPIYIAIGSDVILLALGSLLVRDHLGLLAKCLLALGITTPFWAAFLAPLYYPERSAWFISSGFWLMFGIGAIGGVVVFFLGVFLFTEIDKKNIIRQKDPAWVRNLDILFQLGVVMILSTLAVGRWNQYTLLVMYGGIVLFLVAVVVVIPHRFRAGLVGAGKVMISLGSGGVMISLSAWALGAGRVVWDQMLMGLTPSVITALVGLGIFLSFQKQEQRSEINEQ